jgi:K+-sensing histidine kinase KdpD
MRGEKSQVTEGGRGLFSSDLSLEVTAAHELKAPLTLIRQLALGLEQDGLDKETILRQIVLTSERALRLTTDLSKSARLEDSLFELEPLNPQQLCEEVAHELSPLYKAKNREIHVLGRKKQLLIVANKDLLRRVLFNFGDNALHYAEVDMPVEFSIKALSNGQKVRIGTRDYGPAVPVDMWRQLQYRMTRSAQVMHNRPQSSGLGLYIASQFAEVMNGKIGATRHHDGATFYIDITASTQLSLL